MNELALFTGTGGGLLATKHLLGFKYVNLYPHRDKLAFKGIDYEIYRNNFEVLAVEQEKG